MLFVGLTVTTSPVAVRLMAVSSHLDSRDVQFQLQLRPHLGACLDQIDVRALQPTSGFVRFDLVDNQLTEEDAALAVDYVELHPLLHVVGRADGDGGVWDAVDWLYVS